MIFDRCLGCMQKKAEGLVCEKCGYDDRTTSMVHQLPAGTVLRGRYLVGKVLGQGGFGITYIGWDLLLETAVAIKEFFPNGLVARDHTYSKSVIECEGGRQEYFDNTKTRFLREAKALSKFSNIPEIVHVRNFFEENNTAYIIMEYVQGVDLRTYVQNKGGKLPVEETLRILQPLLRAISVVHSAEMIHRDISPDNIMLLSDGKVKLLDFGAVRDIEGADVDKELSKSTESILKHGFAPMEQYQKRGNLGPWTDVYALCATMYYCMTGEVPPDAPARMLENANPSWYQIPGIKPEQAKALESGTAIRAKNRTATVELLYEQLYQSTSSGKSENKKDPEKKRKSGPVAAILAVVLLAGAAVAFMLFDKDDAVLQKPTEPETTAELTLKTTSVATESIAAENTESALIVPENQETTEPAVPAEPSKEEGRENMKTWNYADDAWKQNILGNLAPPETSTDKGAYSVFGINVPRNKIQSVTFLDNYADAPDTARDVSSTGNGSVLAWVEENGEFYDMYIGAAGGINGVTASKKLFQGYTNLKTVEFGIAYHTEDVVNFSYMFDGCSNLETVSLYYFNTEKASDMSYMFAGCSSLKEINLESFQTAKVMHMTGMFSGCDAVVTVDPDEFNTDLTAKYEGFMDEGGLVNGKPWRELFE